MDLKIGNTTIPDVKATTDLAVPKDVNYVYVGSTLVWQRGSVYSYTLSLGLTYSMGTYILASGERTATLTVTRKTYINGVYQSELDTLVDADSIVFTYEPSGCDFSSTRTSLGTYTISAASRGIVPSAETDATIRVNYTPPSASQIYETATVKQEANAVIDTEYNTVIEISVSSDYDSTEDLAPAAGDSWIVTASGAEKEYSRYLYTSGSYGNWVQPFSSQITASSITISTSGSGLSGSGTGAGTTVTWASRGTVVGAVRDGTVTASYSGKTYLVYVYQQANSLEYTDNRVITSVLLDGVNSNITIPYTSDSITVSGGGTCTEHYTSGSTTGGTFTIGASGFSVSGTGFSYSNYVISVTENSGSQRQGTVTASYSGATSVQRIITQEASVVFPTVITNLAQVSGYGTSATIALSGQVTSWGSGSASSYGIRYKLSSSGTWTNLSCSNISSGVFSVSPNLTGLSAGTYDYQAYATSTAGVTGYGGSNQFTVASAPSYYISVSPSGYAQNQGGDVQVTVTSSHGWNATVNKGDFFSMSISASSGVSGDTPTISILAPVADGTYNGNVTFTCGTATHVFYISVTIGL